jgi:hypothetical protein
MPRMKARFLSKTSGLEILDGLICTRIIIFQGTSLAGFCVVVGCVVAKNIIAASIKKKLLEYLMKACINLKVV